MRIKADIIPAEVYAEYDVPVNPDGYVYVEIRRGMYGLKEAGKIAFDQLVKKLAPFGYSPVEHTPLGKFIIPELNSCHQAFGLLTAG